MSRARSVPAFMVAKSAPWMNGTARAKARNELVGKPFRCVVARRPPALTASRNIGKRSGAITAAGWREVRTIERRARLPTWIVNVIRSATPAPRSPRPRASARSSRGRRRRGSASEAAGSRRGCPRRRARGRCPRGRLPRRERRVRAANRLRIRSIAGRSPASAGTTSTAGRAISALSSAGVPSATIRPWSMIPTRSERTSASSRYWVVRKTVTPSSFASRPTSRQSALRLCGSRPVVGSSRKRMRGRCASASARSRRRFMPPE